MKEKHPALMPTIYMGEEYPAHFRFFENGQEPCEGDIIGCVYDFVPDINEQGKNLTPTVLVWKGGCVNQVTDERERRTKKL